MLIDSRSFSQAEAFHYDGHPREVRIWDEAMLPGDVVTLTTDQLASLRQPCRRQLPDLADAVEALEDSLQAHEDGQTFRMPTLEKLAGRPAQGVLEGLARDRGDPRVSEAAAALLYLAGREVLTHRSHRDKVTSNLTSALDYRDALPADIAPIVILDASGRVRHTYRLWEQHRGDLVRLREAPKDYSDLRVKVWARGGGKGSWGRHGDVLLQGIAAAINTKPEERWLIIHHKDSLGGKLRQRVEDLVTAPRENLCYVQWGSHHGINDYADVSNVILAGTLFLREQTYEALARLAADIRPGVPLPEGMLAELKQGELADTILQGLCRAVVRKSVGASCAPCEGYIIAAPGSGIAELLPGIFPRCTVERWQPVRKKLKGKVAEAVEIVRAHVESCPGEPLMLNDLQKKLGITSCSNFRRAIRAHRDFRDALEELGVVEVTLGSSRHANALSRRSSAFPPLDDEDDEVWDLQGSKI